MIKLNCTNSTSTNLFSPLSYLTVLDLIRMSAHHPGPHMADVGPLYRHKDAFMKSFVVWKLYDNASPLGLYFTLHCNVQLMFIFKGGSWSEICRLLRPAWPWFCSQLTIFGYISRL